MKQKTFMVINENEEILAEVTVSKPEWKLDEIKSYLSFLAYMYNVHSCDILVS